MSAKGEAGVAATFNPSPAVLDLSTSKAPNPQERSWAEQGRYPTAFWQLDTSCSKRVICKLSHERPTLVLPCARPKQPRCDATAATYDSVSPQSSLMIFNYQLPHRGSDISLTQFGPSGCNTVVCLEPCWIWMIRIIWCQSGHGKTWAFLSCLLLYRQNYVENGWNNCCCSRSFVSFTTWISRQSGLPSLFMMLYHLWGRNPPHILESFIVNDFSESEHGGVSQLGDLLNLFILSFKSVLHVKCLSTPTESPPPDDKHCSRSAWNASSVAASS